MTISRILTMLFTLPLFASCATVSDFSFQGADDLERLYLGETWTAFDDNCPLVGSCDAHIRNNAKFLIRKGWFNHYVVPRSGLDPVWDPFVGKQIRFRVRRDGGNSLLCNDNLEIDGERHVFVFKNNPADPENKMDLHYGHYADGNRCDSWNTHSGRAHFNN